MRIKRWFLNNALRNYQYLLYNSKYAIGLDPLDPNIFIKFITKHSLELIAILVTHKHNDHIIGVNKLILFYPYVKVFAYNENKLFKSFIYIKDVDFIDFGFTKFRVIYTPGHVDDHVCFLFEQEKALFCGDVLFNAGVGNTKDKSSDINQLYNSIYKIINLDPNIKIYPAHDYWINNLNFALNLVADDYYFNYYKNLVINLSSWNMPIVNLAEEAKLNIFIRAIIDMNFLKFLYDYKSGRELFIKLRKLKDSFNNINF